MTACLMAARLALLWNVFTTVHGSSVMAAKPAAFWTEETLPALRNAENLTAPCHIRCCLIFCCGLHTMTRQTGNWNRRGHVRQRGAINIDNISDITSFSSCLEQQVVPTKRGKSCSPCCRWVLPRFAVWCSSSQSPFHRHESQWLFMPYGNKLPFAMLLLKS